MTKEGIKEKTVNSARIAKEKFLETKDKAENYVKEHPLTSIAIAAGVGAAVAIGVNALIKPRKRSFLDKIRDRY
ncbi:MAG: hypothetical protein AABY10_04040 [Nanoarchaeota archaeon]